MTHTLTFVGRLGTDPVMQYTPEGNPVTNFSVAVDEYRKGSDGSNVKQVIWLRCSAWGQSAETINKFFKKGEPIWVTGTIIPGADGNPATFKRENGTIGTSYKVMVKSWGFVPSSKGTGGEPAESEEPGDDEVAAIDHGEEKPIPF